MKKVFKIMAFAAAAACTAIFYAYCAPPVSADYTVGAVGDVYNVSDFGAYGNDKKDDTAAIQAALDMAKDANGKITVDIPAGTYYVNSRLLIYSNTTLRLDEKTVMRRTNNLDYILVSGEDAPQRQKDRLLSHDITIDGGTWDGTPSTTKESKGVIKIYNSDNVVFTNAVVTNICGTHFVLFDGVSNLTVKDCEFSNFIDYTNTEEVYRTQVFANLNYWSCEALHIDFLDKSSSLLNGRPYIPCKNVTVSGCTFKNLTSGLGTHHVFDYMSQDNISVYDNYFENCTYDCINAASFRNFKCYDNKAVKCGGFLVARRVDGTVYSNTASLVKNPTGKYYDKGKFSGSPFFYGTEISNKSNLTFKNNTINGASSHGIYVKSSNVTLTDNVISNSVRNGIAVWNGSKAAINRNTVSYSGNNAVSVRQSSVVTECSRNTIKNSSDNGIYVNGSTLVTSKYNKITGSKFNGYSFSSGAKALISDNSISSSSDHGVYISDGSNVTAASNDIKHNAKCAFAVATKSAAKITYNNISGNGSYDLHVRSKSTNVVFNNNGSDKNKTKIDSGCKATITKSKKCLKPSEFKIPSKMTYTGSQIKPNPVSGLKKNKDYTVTYGANVSTGEGTMTIKGKGDYSGSFTLTFSIVPKRQTITKTSSLSGAAVVLWQKDTRSSGYEIDYSTSPNFKNSKRVDLSNSASYCTRLSGLESGRSYYVKVRSYKTINGNREYGSWSAVKRFTVK